MLQRLRREIQSKANPKKAKLLSGFFKTGKGEYGEGDIFLGLVVPVQREIAKNYTTLAMRDLQTLLNSKIHEERLIALLILMQKYKSADKKERNAIYNFYLKNTKRINNWDLVDLSCIRIIGEHLLDKNRKLLYKLAKSSNLWERRIAIISTCAFIRLHDFKDTIKISEILMKDKHDLIHK
ncbi:MAG: DNA alkylation repair protein, partial [archaeon]